MFHSLFSRRSNANRHIADALYDAIVAAARREVFYAAWSVPDTPLGRFEMLSLHMFLVQHRLRRAGGAAPELAQTLIDEFFTDVEHSIRELGISDVGVPKRMKRLARMFYGRAMAYDAAVEAGDADALTAALARNVRPDAPSWPQAAQLARYALTAAAALARQPDAALLSGQLAFPQAGAAGEAGL